MPETSPCPKGSLWVPSRAWDWQSPSCWAQEPEAQLPSNWPGRANAGDSPPQLFGCLLCPQHALGTQMLPIVGRCLLHLLSDCRSQVDYPQLAEPSVCICPTAWGPEAQQVPGAAISPLGHFLSQTSGRRQRGWSWETRPGTCRARGVGAENQREGAAGLRQEATPLPFAPRENPGMPSPWTRLYSM